MLFSSNEHFLRKRKYTSRPEVAYYKVSGGEQELLFGTSLLYYK